MPRRFEQLLETKHPEYVPVDNSHDRTDTLLENIIGNMQRGLKKTQQNLKDLNKSADDGLFGVMTHGTEEDNSDETKIKKSWEGLGQFAQQEWEKKAKEQPPVKNKFGIEKQMDGFEYFREIQIDKLKQYADVSKPRTRREIPDGNNPIDFDNYIQGEWDAMDDADKQRYTDFNEYLDMRKRTEQQRGGQS